MSNFELGQFSTQFLSAAQSTKAGIPFKFEAPLYKITADGQKAVVIVTVKQGDESEFKGILEPLGFNCYLTFGIIRKSKLYFQV